MAYIVCQAIKTIESPTVLLSILQNDVSVTTLRHQYDLVAMVPDI